jgi:protein involved in polysaccharide export with SLBB domain
MATLPAQLLEKNDKTLQQRNENGTQVQQSNQYSRIAVIDGPVDPNEYTVGPGDLYGVNIWLSIPISLQLPVTPEGSVIIPTVGEVSVSGLHLDEAK